MPEPISEEEISKLHEYWSAANYLTVGQIYLKENPLLERPLTVEDIKPRLLGHWGTTAGLNFIYTHLNRVIKQRDLDMMYVIGPGHGGPGIVAHTYLEGSYTELYPAVEQNKDGIKRLFRQFSWPYGIPSHVAPEVPGSIHEGGELGYSLLHAYGAALDNPNLLVTCIVGDGEAETGSLATSWHGNKFLNPAKDGAVLPILHLNGYKIANPTLLARIPEEELLHLFTGYGYAPRVLAGDEPPAMHREMAKVLDEMVDEIHAIQRHARVEGSTERPRWPLLILRTPKGWTGPKEVDGKPVEGTWRAHQVPLENITKNPEHLKMLDGWLRSYQPDKLFDQEGQFRPDLAELAPTGNKRMGMNPHANGGLLLEPLVLPDFWNYEVKIDKPGGREAESTRVLGGFLRDVIQCNAEARNFRVFGPDETASNRLEAVYQTTGKEWMERIEPVDEHLTTDGRVIEVLSENMCEGLLEGYLLTGRHGFFSCYEAFIHIVDSMFNQHAKWLESAKKLSWRKPVASLTYLLSSHVWRQDHNGFSHQDPGFIDHVANKKADIVRIYLPPDANSLLSVADHCLRSRNYVNLIIAGKQMEPVWMDMESAVRHATKGMGVFEWASNGEGDPDVVMACAGDVPTMETLAAVMELHKLVPDIKVRVVNVIDLLALQPSSEHPHGLTDRDFDDLFTKDKPVIFAYHGYPWLIHRLLYRRHNHDNIHVRGYKEEGTTTTPFDMTVRNQLDRFQLTFDAIRRIPRLKDMVPKTNEWLNSNLQRHKEYVMAHGEDLPEIRNWKWEAPAAVGQA